MAIDDQQTALHLTRAKNHVNTVVSQGADIILVKPGTKDEMGYLLTESTLTLKAFPIRYYPYDRDVIQRIAWAENTDMICYVSKLAIENLTMTVEMLRKYIKLRHNSKTYEIKYVEPFSQFANDFLYVLIGANK